MTNSSLIKFLRGSGLGLLMVSQVQAEVVLQNGTVLGADNNIISIPSSSGDFAKQTLIHDFSRFNLEPDDQAIFVKGDELTFTVDNLVANIRDTEKSTLQGMLMTSGYKDARLFLINPHGIELSTGKGVGILEGGVIRHNGPVILSTAKYLDSEDFNGSLVSLALDAGKGKILLDSGVLLSSGTKNELSLLGHEVELNNAILAQATSGGEIHVLAAGAKGGVFLVGTDSIEPESEATGQLTLNGTQLGLEGLPEAIRLEAGNVDITNSGFIASGSRSQGAEITIVGRDGITVASKNGKESQLGGKLGQGGTLLLKSDSGQIHISGSGSKLIYDANDANAGSILLEGQSILLDQAASIDAGSSGGADATAGSISIDADEYIDIGRGVVVSNSAFGTTKAGGIFLSAGDSIAIHGNGAVIRSNASGAKSTGGDIRLIADDGSISVGGGAQVSAFTEGDGQAGSIVLDAGEKGAVYLSGDADDIGEELATLSASTKPGVTGAGGSIQISAGLVDLGNGALVEVSSKGQGDSGNIELKAISGSVVLNPGSKVLATTSGSGYGGTISIDARQVKLGSGAVLSAESVGENSGTSGSVNIKAGQILLSGGRVSVSSDDSDAGDITLNASERLQLEQEAVIATDVKGEIVSGGGVYINHSGAGGAIAQPNQHSLVLLNNGSVVTKVGENSTGTGGNIYINEAEGQNVVVLGNRATINTSAVGQENSNAQFATRVSNTEPASSTAVGQGGNLSIKALEVYQVPGSSIDVRGSEEGLDGNVSFETPDLDETSALVALPDSFLDVSKLTSNRCVARYDKKSSSLVVARQSSGQHPSREFQAVTPEQLVAYQTGRVSQGNRSTSVLRVVPVKEVDCVR